MEIIIAKVEKNKLEEEGKKVAEDFDREELLR